jgi:RNA polymerase sigma-70 factor (ECF subfamily)
MANPDPVRSPSAAARPPVASALESTARLLERVRAGDAGAREHLFARVLPALTRWAHHRLPAGVRDLAETDDLVQMTVARVLDRLDRFESRGEGAFLAYLRQVLLNLVRDQIRRSAVRPRTTELDEAVPDPGPSLLERTVRRETLERYEAALAELEPEQREAVLMRVEFGYSHQEIAEALGKPSADAARMTVARAFVAVARRMHVD